MSDVEGAAQRAPGQMFVHYCEHGNCDKWGSFGFDYGRNVTRWFCMEHRPEYKLKLAYKVSDEAPAFD